MCISSIILQFYSPLQKKAISLQTTSPGKTEIVDGRESGQRGSAVTRKGVPCDFYREHAKSPVSVWGTQCYHCHY